MGLTRPAHHQITTNIVTFDDPILEINKALTGANATDIGFIFNRGSTGDNVAFLWDYSAQEFMLVTTANDGSSSGNLSPSGYADMRVGQLLTENLAFPTVDGTVGQAIITDGNGNLSFGDKLDGNSTVLGGTY